MPDGLVSQEDLKAMNPAAHVRTILEGGVGWDQAEDERRLAAAKGIMQGIDALMEGHTRELGPGEYIGEGEWLLLSSKEPWPRTKIPVQKGYAVLDAQFDLYVRQHQDVRDYSVRLPYEQTLGDQSLTISVDRHGMVSPMTTRSKTPWEDKDAPSQIPKPAGPGRMEHIRKLLYPNSEAGQTLRPFDEEREVIEEHPHHSTQIRVRKKSLLRTMAHGIMNLRS
jgi:hypothetical protein